MENILVWGLLFHFIGDYLLQNDWMASNKTKSSFAAFIHALTYSALFALITNLEEWLVIFGTHFLIDRFRLAVYWIKLVNWNWKSKNYGYSDDKPAFLSIWLLIIIDNTFHILINTLCLTL